ncbi:MAG: FtsW/RodA/SpoVE family cell cycle protein [Paludibacter sp.]|jgi:cell division protein FtsW|nr:FtsW/RodA/SpoVE family cell cycle protein [Paludibacter sp.]
MNSLLKKYLKGDFTLWAVFVGLCLISVMEMYSASSTLAYRAMSHTAPILRHVVFLGMGAFLAFLVHLVPYKYLRLVSYFLLLMSLFTLVLVLVIGKSENDATRWLEIGGFQFQPSELGKLSLIIVAADLIARMKISEANEKRYFPVLAITMLAVCGLILPENFSTAIILMGVIFLMMVIGSVSWTRILKLGGGLMAAATLAVMLVLLVPQEKMPKAFDRAYTWVGRVERFVNEEDVPEEKYVINDENLQVQHGRIAIARGGLIGVFPGNSVQRDFLPQAYSDFIYAIIVEEMGLIGGVFVILLYMILLYRAGRIATKSATVFPAIVMIGLSLMIVFQAFISMAVATSLGPVTGQPLPMISRGGTAILITSIYFGIMFGITRQIKEETDKPVKNEE